MGLSIRGIFEREERDDNISKMGKYEIRIPKPRILVQGILCGYFNIFLWIQNGVSIIFVINLVCHVVGCNWNVFVGIIAETGGKIEVHKLSF